MDNILIIGDTHIPFEHRDYLQFCIETKKRYHCNIIIHIGDLVDNHSISQHPHDPDGFSPYNEYKEALAHLKEWYKAFPKVTVLIGNHDERVERAAGKYGLSMQYFKNFKELWEFPKKWDYVFDYYKYNIRFFHGMGYGGKYAHLNAAVENGQSVVMGHLHSNAGVMFAANESSIIYGLAVGCGIDRHSYAFKYGRDFRRKPLVGCGVIKDNGRLPEFVPMKMG